LLVFETLSGSLTYLQLDIPAARRECRHCNESNQIFDTVTEFKQHYAAALGDRRSFASTMSGHNKRKSQHDSDEEARPPKRFAVLKARVQHVSQNSIRTKWAPLPDAAQNQVRELFRSVERPVLVNQRDERKKIEAQVAVETVLKTYVYGRKTDTPTRHAIRLLLWPSSDSSSA